MKQREGEKVGWIGGWLGAVVWLAMLSIIWICVGEIISGLAALGLFILDAVLVFVLAPWKHPDTKYWKLMLAMLLCVLCSAAICIWLHGGLRTAGLHWSSVAWMTPLIIPFATMGGRRWKDGDTEQKEPGK